MNEIQSINLVNAIRKVVRQEPTNNMLFGKVVSVSPLKIDIGNGLVLTKKFLYLGQMCRPHKVRIPHTHKYSGETKDSFTSITVADSVSGTCVVTDPGHNHSISNQETDNVYNKKQDIDGEDDDYVIAEIYPALKKDDIVLLFAMNNNQMYYVAERIES